MALSAKAKRFAVRLCTLLACLLVWTSPVFADSHYILGVVPQYDVRTIHSIWDPIIERVAREADIKIELVESPSISAFFTSCMNGEYDFAYMNPYQFLTSSDLQGYVPLVKDAGRKLQGIIVVRKDSRFESIKDLDGAMLAFPDPSALGATLLNKASLREVGGLRFYSRYVRTHGSVYLNVALGLTDAGGGVQRTLDAQKPELRDALRIVFRSRPVYPHPLAVHPRVSKGVALTFQKAMLDMAKTPEGQALLEKIPFKKIGAAVPEDYEELRDMGLDKLDIGPKVTR